MNADNDNNERTFVIEGKRNFLVKLEDNTGKEHETEKRTSFISRSHYNFSSKIFDSKRRCIYPFRNRKNYFYNKIKRQRGLWFGRRGITIIIRNLAKEVTNNDIKSIFAKIGPIRRCCIIWNNRTRTKDFAEVEYVYSLDAFKTYRNLDYKSIKGVPIRIEIKDIQRNLCPGRITDRRGRIPYIGNRKLHFRNYYRRMEKIMARRRNLYHSKQLIPRCAMRFWRERRMFNRSRRI